MYVKTLERRFSEKIDREKSTIVDTVEDRIQNKSLTTIDNFIAPMIELVVMSKSASSGRDVASTITESVVNGSGSLPLKETHLKIVVYHVSKRKDET